jgi:hypothetical protein
VETELDERLAEESLDVGHGVEDLQPADAVLDEGRPYPAGPPLSERDGAAASEAEQLRQSAGGEGDPPVRQSTKLAWAASEERREGGSSGVGEVVTCGELHDGCAEARGFVAALVGHGFTLGKKSEPVNSFRKYYARRPVSPHPPGRHTQSMGRHEGDANKLDDPDRPGLAALLAALGVDSSALTDIPPQPERSRYTLELYASERTALDDASIALGISKTSGAKLARAIVRSWLARPWLQPEELASFDFGDDHTWEDSLEEMRVEVAWLEKAHGTVAPLVAILVALSDAERVEVVQLLAASLKPRQLAALRRALGA